MRKRFVFFLLFLFFIILAIVLFFYIKQVNFIKNVKKSFNKYVITNKDTNIYDSYHSIIGNVSDGVYFELDDMEIKTKNDTYFKIRDYDYYLYYSDLSKTNKIGNDSNNYVDLGKRITTGATTNFYQNDDLKLSINNSFSFDVSRMDENYYYISFLNNSFKIKISDVVSDEVIETSPISTYISVINYDSVKDKCDVSNCISTEDFKNQLNYLKENGFYTIDISDYKLWLNGFINLKEKAIFLTSKQKDLDGIAGEFGFYIENDFDSLTYTDSNSKSEKGNTTIPRYNIIDKTTFEIFKKIVNGESVQYIVYTPSVKTHSLPSMDAKATQIAVLNYHFFYDPTIGETCPDGNCKKVQDFENELTYLKNNNYKTLTMDEFVKWMYGEIELPARSVLITIDDGAMGTGTHNGNKLIPILEKYQFHATLFLITGWWSSQNYISPYLDIESHTFDMHEGNYCSGVPRGSKLLCSTKEQVFADLSKSADITGSKRAFCFPMYVYNDTTMQVLKEIGFKLAFVGGDRKATRSSDKYKVPRYHIYRDTSLNQFINMIS